MFYSRSTNLVVNIDVGIPMSLNISILNIFSKKGQFLSCYSVFPWEGSGVEYIDNF
jgi:hypothetical protein